MGQLDGTYWIYQQKDINNAYVDYFGGPGPLASSRVLAFHGDVSPASPLFMLAEQTTYGFTRAATDPISSVKHYNVVGRSLIDRQPHVRQPNVRQPDGPVMEVKAVDFDDRQLTLQDGDGTIRLWQAENIDGTIRKMMLDSEVLTHY